MDKKTEKLLLRLKNLKVGIFIDSSNIYYAQKRAGWKIDYRKFKNFLSKYCHVKVYNFYAAVPKKEDSSYVPTQKYLKTIKRVAGLKTKPLKYIRDGNRITKKGDVDVEIVIDVVRNIEKLDLVIVTSGDSDYIELKNWVTGDKKKKILFASLESNMAWEIRQCWHLYLNKIREYLEYKKS